MDDGECGGWIWGVWWLLALQWLVDDGNCVGWVSGGWLCNG